VALVLLVVVIMGDALVSATKVRVHDDDSATSTPHKHHDAPRFEDIQDVAEVRGGSPLASLSPVRSQ